jgi:hypothetical protein
VNKPIADLPPPVVKPEVALIEDLFDELSSGRLRIPRFQRPFVWKPEDMRELFDSIQKGYPIGSLLFWNTSIPIRSLQSIGPIEVPEAPGNPVTYVLDGQQRLSTLYGVLRLPSGFPLDPAQQHWQWWLWYDLRKETFVHLRHPPKAVPAHLFPLRALLRTMDFLQACRTISEALPTEAAELIERAERLAQKLKSYKMAVIRIQGGTLRQAVEIFSRLNTRGQPMSDDQMVSALTYQEGENDFHLARRINEILEKLAIYHFDGLDRVFVFRAIVAVAGEDIQRSDWAQFSERQGSKLPAIVDAAEAALLQAARFLFEELGVPGSRLLPYALQLVMLSEFFRLCPEPATWQVALLRRWFWATSFSGWFAGANSTQVRQALDEFRKLARGEAQELETMPLDEAARPYPRNFDLRSARVRTLLLVMLQRLQPLRPDGEPFDPRFLIWEHGNRAYRHVFREAKGDIVSNPANRILLPPVPGKMARTQLLDIPSSVRSQVLASHLISDDAHEALYYGNERGFIERRAADLAELERDFMTELDLPLPPSEFGETDIDTDDEE